jgi:hypothetical protein
MKSTDHWLLPRNKVADAHPLRFGLKGLENLPVFPLSDAWLSWRGVQRDANPNATLSVHPHP